MRIRAPIAGRVPPDTSPVALAPSEVRLAALGNEDETTDRGEVIQLDGRWYALLKE